MEPGDDDTGRLVKERPTLLRYSPAIVSEIPENCSKLLDEAAANDFDAIEKLAMVQRLLPEMPSHKAAVETVLNHMYPPRQWINDGKLLSQYVSTALADRADVQKTQEEFDRLLIERKANEVGICPCRYNIVLQCFDELIRQVAVLCPQRALLLLRVKEEARLTIGAYEALCRSAVSHSMIKEQQLKQSPDNTEGTLQELLAEQKKLNDELEKNLFEIQAQKTSMTQSINQIKAKNTHEVEFMRQQLAFLESLFVNTHTNRGKKITMHS